jgi:hypothetical protein
VLPQRHPWLPEKLATATALNDLSTIKVRSHSIFLVVTGSTLMDASSAMIWRPATAYTLAPLLEGTGPTVPVARMVFRFKIQSATRG